MRRKMSILIMCLSLCVYTHTLSHTHVCVCIHCMYTQMCVHTHSLSLLITHTFILSLNVDIDTHHSCVHSDPSINDMHEKNISPKYHSFNISLFMQFSLFRLKYSSKFNMVSKQLLSYSKGLLFASCLGNAPTTLVPTMLP